MNTDEPPLVYVVAPRKNGKRSVMIDLLLDRADERGIRVQVIDPHPPTREQIAEAISEVRQGMERDQLACLSTDEAFHRLEAALIQNGADR